MKLYTEERVKEALKLAKWYFAFTEKGHDAILELIKPIELPSDEEIEKKADEYVENKWEYAQDECKETFTDCAKWLRDKILNQNK